MAHTWVGGFGLDTVREVRERLAYVPPDAREQWLAVARRFAQERTPEWLAENERAVAQTRHLVRLLRDGGVGLLAGTDAPNPWVVAGFSLHDELGLLVEAGLSPHDALRAATSQPARFLGVLDSLGTIEAGKLADLVLLEADPLIDIRNTRRIRAVVANGMLFEHAALAGLFSDAERAANQGRVAPPR